jgi:LysR family cys regulon transcriptional activator
VVRRARGAGGLGRAAPPRASVAVAGEADLAIATEAIAAHPIVTYDFAFANRSLVQKTFEAKGLATNVVLTALDADVIKTYVALGLGVGIMAKMAFDASHLFASSTTRLGIKRGARQRGAALRAVADAATNLQAIRKPRPLRARPSQG